MGKKILIFKPGALGDTILTFPLLKNLIYHNWDVTFVGNPEYLELISYFHLGKGMDFNHSIFFPLFKEELLQSDPKIHSLKTFFHSFRYIIVISRQKKDLFFKNLQNIDNKNKMIFCNSIPPFLIPIRIYYAQTILKIIHNQNPKFLFYTQGHTIKKEKSSRTINILLHPGSGSPEKIWKLENFFFLIEKLLFSNHIQITIIEGPAERGIGQHFLLHFPNSNRIHITAIGNVWDLISLIPYHDFYIGNDSGLTHLASILGISGVAIFGKTNPWLWNPSPNIVCLYQYKHKNIDFPSPNMVYSYIKDVVQII